jgi:hypothetical protein
MINRSFAILTWLLNLFAPPPLDSMNHAQKIGRVLVFTAALVVMCILISMLAAVGVFALEHARRMAGGGSELLGDLGIIFVSMVINTVCVLVLLEVRKADRKLIPPSETPTQLGTEHSPGGTTSRSSADAQERVPPARPESFDPSIFRDIL